MRPLSTLAIAFFAAASSITAASAQNPAASYPGKPVRIVVIFTTGFAAVGADTIANTPAQYVAFVEVELKRWGQGHQGNRHQRRLEEFA